jgi:hypothetical protein
MLTGLQSEIDYESDGKLSSDDVREVIFIEEVC